MIRLAAKNMMRRKTRTAIVLISVMISAALLISALSIGNGIVATVGDRLAGTNVDIVITGSGLHSIKGGHERIEEITQMDGVDFASPLLISERPIQVTSQDNTGMPYSPFPLGIMPESILNVLPESNIQRIEGWFQQTGDPHYNNGGYDGDWTYEMGMDNGLANALGVGLNDTVQVNMDGQWVDFNVSLILTPNFGGEAGTGLFISFFHLSELQSMVGLDKREDTGEVLDAVDTITVVATAEYKSDGSKFFQLQDQMVQAYPFHDVESKEELVSEMEAQVAMAEAFSLAIGGIAFVIGALFVTASMVIAVDERKGEIGMLRAIGFSTKTIFSIFFSESLIMVLAGTLGGVGLGYVFQGLLDDYLAKSFGITLSSSVFSSIVLFQYFALVLLLGSIASLYPAGKACRTKVVHTLREAGR